MNKFYKKIISCASGQLTYQPAMNFGRRVKVSNTLATSLKDINTTQQEKNLKEVELNAKAEEIFAKLELYMKTGKGIELQAAKKERTEREKAEAKA